MRVKRTTHPKGMHRSLASTYVIVGLLAHAPGEKHPLLQLLRPQTRFMIDVPWKLHAHMGAHRVEGLHHVCGSDAVQEQMEEEGNGRVKKVAEEAVGLPSW